MKKTHWFPLVLALALLASFLAGPAAVSASGPVGGTFLIANQPVDTVYPAVAYNSQAQEYLVVWYNDRPGNDDIYGQRVSRNGTPAGPWFSIAAGVGAERRYPDVAYNVQHNEYLVVWEHYDGAWYNIHGRIVSATGGFPAGEITLGSGPALKDCYRPAVDYAFTSDKYLVVWENHVSGGISSDIEGQVLTGAGALQSGNFFIAQGTWSFSYERPDLAYNRRGNGYLVAWQQLDKGSGIYDIYGRLVHGDGTPMPGSIEIMRVSSSQRNPAVAAIPTATAQGQYLVAWELDYTPTDRDIAARLVNGDGTVTYPTIYPSYITGEDEVRPAVAGSESNQQYLVAWTQSTSAPAVSSIHDLAISSGNSFLGAATTVNGLFADHAAVASGPVGDFLVASDDPVIAANRDVYGRFWGNRLHLPLVLKNH